MREIVEAILDNGKAYDVLGALLEAIDHALWSINPATAQQYRCLGQFIGRPLVVANASVRLELLGMPQLPRSLGIAPPGKTTDVRKAEFTLHVGRTANQQDGAIGFFLNEDFSHLHLVSPMKKDVPSFLEPTSTIPLSLGDAAPTRLTLLMDYAASVDLITGVLPVKTVKLPGEVPQALQAGLCFTFFSGPVLGDPAAWGVPTPAMAGREWHWIQRNSPDQAYSTQVVASPPLQETLSASPPWARDGWLKSVVREKE
jgi:hypothetical protein